MRHWDDNFILKLQEQLSENLISSAEFVSSYLLQYPLQKPLQLQKKKLISSLQSCSSTIQKINDFHWKGYNDRIRRSLIQWHDGQYPLVLWHHIPSPFELLQIQSEGRRVVTVFVKPEEIDQLHHGKDSWHFVVHDLIHADHFFERPDWREGQISFYRFLLRHWDHPEMASLHHRGDFEYLIADMNSHPRHMFWTLKAIVLQSLKEKQKRPPKEPLDIDTEIYYQYLMQEWLSELNPDFFETRNAMEIS